MKSRQKIITSEASVKEFNKHDRLMVEVGAALGGGIMAQQKLDFFLSFACGEKAAEDFTALPPP